MDSNLAVVDDNFSSDVPEMIVLKFADSKIPVFKETRNKDYIRYGEDNKYPEYLTYLFNKSAKHNAIITGKAKFIFGDGYENGDMTVNRLGESLNDISKKALLDVEIYGGFYLEIVWNRSRRIQEIYHVDFTTIRVGKEGGFFYKDDWGKWTNDEQPIPAFDPNVPIGTQIYSYMEYRPMAKYYPLPGYIGCNNYIETDIEVGKFYLSSIRNGMMPSKMIQFFKGEPSTDKKREIEARFAQKFAGAENAGKFIMVFNDLKADKGVQVDDLSGTELDKMFIELNKTVQQEIFSGHGVTNPMLFGIKTEGQLGGATELKTSYEIFVNTYAKPKADAFDKELMYLLSYSVWPGEYDLQQTDPVGLQFDVKDFLDIIPEEYVLEKLGIPKEYATTPTSAVGEQMVNENLKNLTGKQNQSLNRIVREYKKGIKTESVARALLKSSLGLDDELINLLLDIKPVQLSKEFSLEEVIGMFDSCGDSKKDYEILRSKKVVFSEAEAAADEEVYKEAFKTYDITATEDAILTMIKKDERITPEVIARSIGETVAYVRSKIDSLVKRGYLETTVEKIGLDEIIKRNIPKSLDITAPPTRREVPLTQIMVRYSYEVKPNVGPEIIPTTRPFCIKMIELDRLYSRADIEKISQRLGYSVFERKGGYWGPRKECRHRWVSHIVVKKGGNSL